jgi:hypothetical protein
MRQKLEFLAEVTVAFCVIKILQEPERLKLVVPKMLLISTKAAKSLAYSFGRLAIHAEKAYDDAMENVRS